ncbi:MAG: HAMP domain-containing histidine kinase [Lachnospiraceae bacterium]|nr:HAMP domain-containing histidine kinase [Lachnospiraceae bacterium]
MGLKKSFVMLSVFGMITALLIISAVFLVCGKITAEYPRGGMMITSDGVVRELEGPIGNQKFILRVTEWVEILACILVPVGSLVIASLLFYQYKLRKPIAALQMGMEKIREQDLTFSLPDVSGDELGQVCATFEMMRAELLQTNQELWRQAEERKRLNAAFSHDLRNPVTVLKGTVKLLRQGTADEHALERLETYVLRLERYVEAMSSIQRLEQMPVQKKEVKLSLLCEELEETARLLASSKNIHVYAGEDSADNDTQSLMVDHGLFLTVAENLIGNAARYAKSKISIGLSVCTSSEYFYDDRQHFAMTITDDGNGYPSKLIREGAKPFGKIEEDAAHFGMGLYTSQMLCIKHGGQLLLENGVNGGAKATAIF